MTTEVRIPQLGESVTEGIIARWLRQDGDVVRADEPILELETDKATMEIPAPASGRLRIVESQGATARVGALVARIEDAALAESAGAAPARTPTASAVTSARTDAPPARPVAAAGDTKVAARVTATPAAAGAARSSGGAPQPRDGAGTGHSGATASAAPATPLVSPAPRPSSDDEPLAPSVRKLVAEHGLDPAAIAGTGKGNRITKEDVLRHIEDRRAPSGAPHTATAPATPTGAAPATVGPRAPASDGRLAQSPGDETERVPMTTLRRRIAERLVEAQHTAAILTTFNEVDCGELMAVRKRYRERFKATHDVDLGLMSLFGRAVVLALRDVPIVNARIDGGDVVQHRHVHLGIAVATPRGLVVPVVRYADRMSLADLERAIAAVAERARSARLAPDDLAGGTFSITNGGIFGSLLSTPILNPPQSGILGMHKIQERPVAVNGQVVIRPMMYVALSYDHRLVDGQQAVTFLVRVKERLEDPVRMLLEV